MDLERRNSFVARVTFDDIEERFIFGANAPFFSREYWREIRSRIPGIEAYVAADFPQTVEISHKIVGRVLGSVAASSTLHGNGYFNKEATMADRMTQYFQDLRDYSDEMTAIRERLYGES